MSEEKIWRVLYTKPRFEKKVQQQFINKKIESFLPLHSVIRKWSDRKKKIEEPLFPGYIFIHVNEKERLIALQTSGVVKCVMFNRNIAIVREKEIDDIRCLIRSGNALDVHRSLVVGRKVKIIQGPLLNMEGILTEIRGNKKFAVSVNALSSSVLVEVPINYLEEV